MAWTRVKKLIAGSILCVGALVAPMQSAIACNMERTPSPPAGTTRTYQNQSLGFSFELPSNYRLMASQYGNRRQVLLLSPETYDFLECVTREQLGMGGNFGNLNMVSRRVSGNPNNLQQLVRQEFDSVNRIQIADLDGRSAAVFSYYDLHDSVTFVSVAFIAPGNGEFVTLTGIPGDPIFMQVIDTFQFD